MAIGERIRWFRNRSGMTQRQLGQQLGINNMSADSRIGQYEIEARSPKKDVIEKLVDPNEKELLLTYMEAVASYFAGTNRYV